ncbi:MULTISPECIES: lysozyme [unclassified Sinorhizobium]|uniref:lysozyme n=1 Tax=unclassified Sinorhizobium TaxID=2613772 RepID=UPI0035240671
MAGRLKKGSAIAAAAVALVGGFEGLRTVAYRDPVGIPTVCFGETRGVKMGDKYTVQQCKDMLGARLIEFETDMRSCLSQPDKIPDKPYIAFLSFTYNLGKANFCGSTMVRKINAGDLKGACNELPKWNKATLAGVRIVLPGLTKRRAEEQRICLEGA